jgi:putative aminopeptidase FrvX
LSGPDYAASTSSRWVNVTVRGNWVTDPTRYTHSPIETVDEGDLRGCVDLLVAFATTTDGG